MAEAFQAPIGTRDFAPGEAHVRAHVARTLESVFARYNYHSVQTPTFESLELFTAKSGEGVIDELYAFQDKGERDLCLRPELTAPTMRMYFTNHFNDPKPIKWYYFGNCFRYDRPQAGRYREFWQFGCEQIGAGTPLAYAELMALASDCLAAVGLHNRDFQVGHVGILKHCVEAFEFDAATRAQLMRAIDKRDDEAIKTLARSKQGCAAALDRLFLVMDAPTVAAAAHALQADLETGNPDFEGVRQALRDLEATFEAMRVLGVTDARLNLGIARGLDYYTGIVFEIHCPILGAQKQLLGGGGYDLSAVFGGQSTPTMGFGLGFDRTIVALEEEAKRENRKPHWPALPRPVAYLGALTPGASGPVLSMVQQLRRHDVRVDVDLMQRKPGAMAKAADAMGAKYLVMVGDRDLESGRVQVKELATGGSADLAIEHVVDYLRQHAR